MKKIISIIKPFFIEQSVLVYEDGNKIDAFSVKLKDIIDTLIETAKKYDAKEIQLVGSKKFSQGIQEKIEKAEMAKYGKNDITVKIIKN